MSEREFGTHLNTISGRTTSRSKINEDRGPKELKLPTFTPEQLAAQHLSDANTPSSGEDSK